MATRARRRSCYVVVLALLLVVVGASNDEDKRKAVVSDSAGLAKSLRDARVHTVAIKGKALAPVPQTALCCSTAR